MTRRQMCAAAISSKEAQLKRQQKRRQYKVGRRSGNISFSAKTWKVGREGVALLCLLCLSVNKSNPNATKLSWAIN